MSLLLHLLVRHLRQYPGRSLLAMAVVLVSGTLLLALGGIAAALHFRVGNLLEHIFPSESIRLEMARGALGPLALDARPLTDDVLAAVRALPQAEAVWPIEGARFPLSVEGVIFNQYLASDAVVYGVDRALVEDALPAGETWQTSLTLEALPLLDSLSQEDRAPGSTPNFLGPHAAIPEIPIVVSRYFLDMYNLGLARASGLPALNPQYFIGKHLGVVLGASSIGLGASKMPARYARGRVVGFTAQPGLLGLAVPAGAVRAWNAHFAPYGPPQYVMLVAHLRPGADRAAFLAAAGKLGLTTGSGDALGEQLKLAVRGGAAGLAVLAAAVLALGLLSATQLFALLLHARRPDLMRLRALGLGARRAALLALAEVGLLAGVGGLAAAGIVWGLLGWAREAAAPLLAKISWLPPDLLAIAPGWLLAGAAALCLLTLLPTLPLLRWVLRTEPGTAIRDL